MKYLQFKCFSQKNNMYFIRIDTFFKWPSMEKDFHWSPLAAWCCSYTIFQQGLTSESKQQCPQHLVCLFVHSFVQSSSCLMCYFLFPPQPETLGSTLDMIQHITLPVVRRTLQFSFDVSLSLSWLGMLSVFFLCLFIDLMEGGWRGGYRPEGWWQQERMHHSQCRREWSRWKGMNYYCLGAKLKTTEMMSTAHFTFVMRHISDIQPENNIGFKMLGKVVPVLQVGGTRMKYKRTSWC